MYGRRASPPHHKSMGSYNLFAWRDAMALAHLLETMFDLKTVRKVFDHLGPVNVVKWEAILQEDIGNLLQKTEAQRPAYLRKMAKAHPKDPHRPAFTLLLAVIAQVRVTRLLELRDEYRGSLAPGEGNRVTCASAYDFGMAVARLHQQAPSFPFEVFEAYGSSAMDEDEDEGDDPDDESSQSSTF